MTVVLVILSFTNYGATSDLSVQVDDGDYTSRIRNGCLRDIWTSSQAPAGFRKSLNGLSLKNPHAAIELSPYASDVRAVHRTRHDIGCIAALDTGEVRWGLVATTGAHSYWHPDNGEATYVRVAVGQKVWYIAKPKSVDLITSTHYWSDPERDITNLDLSLYDVEVIVLEAGDTLYVHIPFLHTRR